MSTVKITDLPAAGALSADDMMYVVQRAAGSLTSRCARVQEVYDGIKDTMLADPDVLDLLFQQPALVGATKFFDFSAIHTLKELQDASGETDGTNKAYTPSADVCIVMSNASVAVGGAGYFTLNGVEVARSPIWRTTDAVTETITVTQFGGTTKTYNRMYIKAGTQITMNDSNADDVYVCPLITAGENANFTGEFIDYGAAVSCESSTFWGRLRIPFDCVANFRVGSTVSQCALSSVNNFIMPTNIDTYRRAYITTGHQAGHNANDSSYPNPAFLYLSAGTVVGLRPITGGVTYIAPLVGANLVGGLPEVRISLQDFKNSYGRDFNQMPGIYEKLSPYLSDMAVSKCVTRSDSGLVTSIGIKMKIKEAADAVYGMRVKGGYTTATASTSSGLVRIKYRVQSRTASSTKSMTSFWQLLQGFAKVGSFSYLTTEQALEINQNTCITFQPYMFQKV